MGIASKREFRLRHAVSIIILVFGLYALAVQLKNYWTYPDCLSSWVYPATFTENRMVIGGAVRHVHLQEFNDRQGVSVLELHNSYGGYKVVAEKLVEAVDEVHITGTGCASMCVVIALSSPKVRLGKDLSHFTFHSAVTRDRVTCAVTHQVETTRAIIADYPPALRTRLETLLHSDTTVVLTVEEVENMLGQKFPRLS